MSKKQAKKAANCPTPATTCSIIDLPSGTSRIPPPPHYPDQTSKAPYYDPREECDPDKLQKCGEECAFESYLTDLLRAIAHVNYALHLRQRNPADSQCYENARISFHMLRDRVPHGTELICCEPIWKHGFIVELKVIVKITHDDKQTNHSSSSQVPTIPPLPDPG